MRRLLLVLHLIGFVNLCNAQPYYFSSTSGDDISGDGSINSPWQTIAKLNSLNLVPGDTIYLKKGDVFHGEIILMANEDGSSATPIVFTGYGSGNNPMISGAETLSTGWTSYAPVAGSYQITSSRKVKQLIVNGVPIESAKYPDNGFLTVDSMYPGNTGFYDAALSGIGFNPTGYPICNRTSLWTWETREVNTYDGGSQIVLFDSAPQLDSFPSYGYYFYNHLSLLSAPGEWFSDTLTQTVYYYPSNSSTPASQTIEGSVYDYGIKGTLNNAYIKIIGLDFHGQYTAAIDFGDAGFFENIIDSCNFSAQYLYGVHFGGMYGVVKHSNFRNIEGRGVFFDNMQNGTVSYSNFTNIGMFRSGGTNDQDNFTAITSYGGNVANVLYSNFDSIGYCGIRCDAPSSYVMYNLLSNTMLLLTDGGAIKAFGSAAGVYIASNFVSKCYGNNLGAPPNTSFKPAALYLDFYTTGCSIVANTVENIQANGIFINGGSDDHLVKDNVVYGALEHLYTNDRFTTDPIDGDSIIHNVFYCTSPSQICVREGSRNDYIMGGYRNNYYVNPYVQSHLIRRISTSVNDSFDLTTWQSLTGFDQNTVDTYFHWNYPTAHDTLIKNETINIINVDLTSNLYFDLDSNVICWPFSMDPYSSRVLIDSETQCPLGIDPGGPNPLAVAVYPNPAKEFTQVFVNVMDDNNYQFSLFNLNGQMVLSSILTNTITQIPLNELSPGLYLYRIEAPDKRLAVGKLIIQ